MSDDAESDDYTPTTSSSRKKAESIPRRIVIRVDFERPILMIVVGAL